jgi:hypothetical protein
MYYAMRADLLPTFNMDGWLWKHMLACCLLLVVDNVAAMAVKKWGREPLPVGSPS